MYPTSSIGSSSSRSNHQDQDCLGPERSSKGHGEYHDQEGQGHAGQELGHNHRHHYRLEKLLQSKIIYPYKVELNRFVRLKMEGGVKKGETTEKSNKDCFNALSTRTRRRRIYFFLDGFEFAWIWKNLRGYQEFRQRFLCTFNTHLGKESAGLKVYFVMEESTLVIDKIGSMLSNSYVSVRCELETALSWLSTLGGAFSALGDLSVNYANEAAQVSLKQLKIAWKMSDPLIESRCRIYMAISLIQRGSLQEAKRSIKREYDYAMSLPEGMDPRLRRMCLGVWSKLQYAWWQRYNSRQMKKASSGTNGKYSTRFPEFESCRLSKSSKPNTYTNGLYIGAGDS